MDGIKYYRSQLNGEKKSGWTVVDASVQSYTAENASASEDKLYVQQSYDGKVWCASGLATTSPAGTMVSDNRNRKQSA